MDAETSTTQTGVANSVLVQPTDAAPTSSGKWDRGQYYGFLVDGQGNQLIYRASPERKSVSIMSEREYRLWGIGRDVRKWDEVHAKREGIEKTREKEEDGCTTCNKASARKAIAGAKEKTSILDAARKFAKGVPGAIKANLGADKAPDDAIASRRSICESCDLFNFGMCDPEKGGCGCVLSWKVSLASESCPKGKWGSVGKQK